MSLIFATSIVYMSPNDEQESDRLDLYHHIALLQLKGEPHLTPLGEDFAGRVLDLGAGTGRVDFHFWPVLDCFHVFRWLTDRAGIWAMDMADRYPGATVIGVDLSPTQEKSVPPNCQFEVDDIEEPWTFQRPFDYIHSRWLAGAIRDWPRLVQQCYDHVAPGGWVEFKDWDYRARMPNGSLDLPDNHVKQWHDLMGELAEKSGATAKPVVGLKDLVIAKGFVNVRETVFQTPVGDWPKDPALKEIGRFNRLGIEEGLDAISLRLLTQLAGWSVLEAQALNANFRRQIREFPVYHN